MSHFLFFISNFVYTLVANREELEVIQVLKAVSKEKTKTSCHVSLCITDEHA